MQPTVEQLREENRILQLELNRMEDLLSASRAERDEIGIKYRAISERVSRLGVTGTYTGERCVTRSGEEFKQLIVNST